MNGQAVLRVINAERDTTGDGKADAVRETSRKARREIVPTRKAEGLNAICRNFSRMCEMPELRKK